MQKAKAKKKNKSHAATTKTRLIKAGKLSKDGRIIKLKADGKTADTKPTEWTRDVVLAELQTMLEEVRNRADMIFIGELFLTRNYSRTRVAEWRITFKDDDEIPYTIGTIEQILETRVAVGGLKGLYNANFTKFHMINNHDWKDKSEVDNTHRIPTLGDIFDAAAKRRKEAESEE